MKDKIEINGKSFSLEELNALIEAAKSEKPIDEVYNYHGITEEEFNSKHRNSSDFIKAIDREALIVSFYNKGEDVDFDNSNQKKWYPYFAMDSKNFRFGHSLSRIDNSTMPTALCFLREADLKDAVEKYLPQYKNSRLSSNKR